MNMTDKPKEAVFRILHDLPTDNDAFGPHTKIAETLATMIAGPAETSNKDKEADKDTEHAGYFVALEGSWGSGKSTVIKKLRKCLDKDKSIKSQTIIFDAWAHSGDHLRRAFLETIIHSLLGTIWYEDKDGLKKELKSLSGRYKESTEKRIPKFSIWGIIFGLSLLLVPLGGILASVTLGKESTVTPTLSFISNDLLGTLSLTLCVLPLFILFLAWLFAWCINTGLNKDINVWGLMLNQWEKETDILTTADPDSSSIEFQQKFKKLASKVLEHKDRRLVIVIDNLDRISPSEAMQVWRTLQTFIDKNGHDGQKWEGKLWTIVPYARSILKQHFNSIRIKTYPEKTLSIENQETGELEHFEKVFDIRLHVPTPLLDAWEEYCKSQFHDAFPKESEEEIDKAVQLLALNAPSKTSTPRKIKRIINAAGSTYIGWGQHFDLVLIVYYALETQDNFDFDPLSQRALHSEAVESPEVIKFLGNGYSRKLAAIQNNMPIELACETLHMEDIRKAFPSINKNILIEIRKQSPAYAKLLYHVVRDYVRYPSLLELVEVTATISKSDTWPKLEIKFKDRIQHILSRTISIKHEEHLREENTLNQQELYSNHRAMAKTKHSTASDFLNMYIQATEVLQEHLPNLLTICNNSGTSYQLFEIFLYGYDNQNELPTYPRTAMVGGIIYCCNHMRENDETLFRSAISKVVLSEIDEGTPLHDYLKTIPPVKTQKIE